ncbi:hypothetical protein ACFLU6_14365 [Acidobacteriota bacterium]
MVSRQTLTLLFVAAITSIGIQGLLAQETDKVETQLDTAKKEITEEWQTNPEAFAKLFYGDDLSIRPKQKPSSLRKIKISVIEKVKGSYVEWPVTFGIWPVWRGLPEKMRRDHGANNLGLFYMIGPEPSGWMDLNDSYRQEGTRKIKWKQMTWGIPPQSIVHVKMKLESVNPMIMASGMLMLDVRGGQVEIETSSKKCDWPEYNSEIYASPVIAGIPVGDSNEVRVTSGLGFQIKVGLRSDDKGIDFIVPKVGAVSTRVPGGKYDIYFQYASDPTSLYQGDSLDVTSSGVEIHLKGEGTEGYKIRKMK